MTKAIPPKNIVLYADDDIDDLQLVEESFGSFANNVEVITVTDGMRALQYLKGLDTLDPKPCLIILDINMPRLSGKEVLQELRKNDNFKETPVVLFTTSSLQQDKDFARKYNAGLITKPIDVKQMEFITTKFIEHCNDDIQKLIRRQFKG